MNEDNKKLGYIEGGRFESIKAGDDRDATIAEIKMPDNFPISARPVIILEIDEWDKIKNKINKLKAKYTKATEKANAENGYNYAGIYGMFVKELTEIKA